MFYSRGYPPGKSVKSRSDLTEYLLSLQCLKGQGICAFRITPAVQDVGDLLFPVEANQLACFLVRILVALSVAC